MRLIDADALIVVLKRKAPISDAMRVMLAECLEEVRHAPTIEPERKRGEWIKHKDRTCWFCSECNTDNYYAYTWNSDTGKHEFQDNYCPNCGARMMKGE